MDLLVPQCTSYCFQRYWDPTRSNHHYTPALHWLRHARTLYFDTSANPPRRAKWDIADYGQTQESTRGSAQCHCSIYLESVFEDSSTKVPVPLPFRKSTEGSD